MASSLIGCGFDVNSAVPVTPAGPVPVGKLQVYLQTNPQYFEYTGDVRGFNEINLAIEKVQLHANADAVLSDVGWVDLPLQSGIKGEPKDFTQYVVNTLVLVNTDIPAGKYQKLKIVFKPNSIGLPWLNYVWANLNPAVGAPLPLTVSFPANFANGIAIPIKDGINLTENSSAFLGLTLDLRSIFTLKDRTYMYRPVATAIDLRRAGGIELNVAENDGTVLVSAQLGGKIIRSIYAPKAGGKVTLNQLPTTINGADGLYNVVLSSRHYPAQIIQNIPVLDNSRTTPFISRSPLSFIGNPGEIKTLITNLKKPTTPEVEGTMGVEILQKLGTAENDPFVVVDYVLSAPSELDTIPASIGRHVSYEYRSGLQLIYNFFPASANYLAAPYAFAFRSDPDLSTVKTTPFLSEFDWLNQ
jgi:hypothetical protein